MDSSNNQHQQQNSGLLRYRSAPCNFLDDNSCGGFDADKLISRFMVSNSNKKNNTSSNSIAVSQGFRSSEGNKFSFPHSQQLPPQYPRQSLNNSSTSTAMQSSLGMVGSSMAMGSEMPARGVSSNLMRQNSSPAGLFSHISAQNGYTSINGIGNYGGFNGTNGDITQSPKRLKSQMSFSSGLPSSLGVLSRISEVPNEGIEASVSDEGKLGNGIGGPRYCSPEFPYVSWGDTSLFSENVTVMKTEPDIDGKLFSGSQNGEFGNRIPTLSHHLSLPKISSELVSMGKILHFQDAVPCKIRAKRGCATHPRSIAERMRRTRISERMRKLQELVPQMDKQTNTSDMLDLAVEYIKDLQKQYKTLSDRQANCKCTDRQKPVQN